MYHFVKKKKKKKCLDQAALRRIVVITMLLNHAFIIYNYIIFNVKPADGVQQLT